MAKQLQKLELTWIGKGNEPKLEPRILIEDPSKSFGDPKSENMLIHGDNLLALKALEQNFTGQIKCISVDPPYNTGNAFEHYDDGIEHSQWLNLMKPRLEILKNLLHKDGSIWINIDADESHYLKVLCDEVFGRQNFVDEVVWQRAFAPINLKKTLSRSHDIILVYAKNIQGFELNKLIRSDTQLSNYKNPDNDHRGVWTSGDLSVGPPIEKNIYEITTPNGRKVLPPKGYSWRLSKERLEEFIQDNRIWFGKDGNNVPRIKRFVSEVKDGVTPMTLWLRDEVGDNQEAKREIKEFNSINVFTTPKPERLISRVVQLATNEGDWVLDSFLGSGTTSAVAHKMKRRWIGIELGEHATTHCLPRLQQVVSGKDKGGISEAVDWKGGGGFKFYTLAPSLVQKDKYGTEIINPQYNANMLAAAMAKQEGFRYQPDENNYWKQGMSSEKDFIFTTTQFVTVAMLDKLAEELQPGESLLVCCKSFAKGCANRHTNITIKKIPQMLLGRCEFGKDDYSFNIVNLPHDNDDFDMEDGEESEAPKPVKKSKAKKQKDDDTQSSLF
ncbi:site-specific DNA-methyltransferase [Sphingobacteriales bacterium UPWRP_1]|nr:site-specific DNA-methyltransferase [Sphingobacteriales bacterium TSM_CSS]PSJ73822.1 site-specific DNA-methyltransferase [Sphingobacteriales bacterium UPWRP_1]